MHRAKLDAGRGCRISGDRNHPTPAGGRTAVPTPALDVVGEKVRPSMVEPTDIRRAELAAAGTGKIDCEPTQMLLVLNG